MVKVLRFAKNLVKSSAILSFITHHLLRQALRAFRFSEMKEVRVMNWMADFSSEDKIEFTNKDGIHFYLNLREYVQVRIYCYDYYESNCVKAFVGLIKNGRVMVDVGANIGQYSLLASHLLGSNGYVVAFEPDPDIGEYLQQNIQNNQLEIEVEHCALGDERGVQSFYPPGWDGNLGQGSLLPAGGERPGIRKQEPLNVDVYRLDDVMQSKGIQHIDFLKVDVEGYEMHVLKGAEELLSNQSISAMMIEVSPDNLLQSEGGYESLLSYLSDFNYTPFIADKQGQLVPLPLPIDSDVNVFFLSQVGHAKG